MWITFFKQVYICGWLTLTSCKIYTVRSWNCGSLIPRESSAICTAKVVQKCLSHTPGRHSVRALKILASVANIVQSYLTGLQGQKIYIFFLTLPNSDRAAQSFHRKRRKHRKYLCFYIGMEILLLH